MSTTIWQVYHDECVKDQLLESKKPYYKSFYTKENTLNGKNLNHLQQYLNEFVCQYYVYRNDIKSDIVGFCQYSKFFDDTMTEELNQNLYIEDPLKVNPEIFNIDNLDNTVIGTIQYNCKPILQYDNCWTFLYRSLSIYIETHYPQWLEKFKNFDWKDESIRFETFICTWDNFCNYMKFILGFFKFIGINFITLTEDDINQVIEHYQIEYYMECSWYKDQPHRRIAFIIEILGAIYWSLTDNNLIFNYI